MQLTKDDVKKGYDPMKVGSGNIQHNVEYIELSKFQQVVAFYEKYKDRDWHHDLFPLWENHMKEHWNDWLFNYCFKDGFK